MKRYIILKYLEVQCSRQITVLYIGDKRQILAESAGGLGLLLFLFILTWVRTVMSMCDSGFDFFFPKPFKQGLSKVPANELEHFFLGRAKNDLFRQTTPKQLKLHKVKFVVTCVHNY